MKTIGLLGGMSWESTANYYRAINEGIKSKLGGMHSAKISMYSVDFDEIQRLQHQDRWDDAAKILSDAAKKIELAGADFLLICTNTMHIVVDAIQAEISIPILHIADATAELLLKEGINKVGLLGTQFTMEKMFYRGRLEELHKINVLVPEVDDQSYIHRVIFNELCLGKVEENSKQQFIKIIDQLHDSGSQGVILGCTEIAMLVKSCDTPHIPLFDTTAIHAASAVEKAVL